MEEECFALSLEEVRAGVVGAQPHHHCTPSCSLGSAAPRAGGSGTSVVRRRGGRRDSSRASASAPAKASKVPIPGSCRGLVGCGAGRQVARLARQQRTAWLGWTGVDSSRLASRMGGADVDDRWSGATWTATWHPFCPPGPPPAPLPTPTRPPQGEALAAAARAGSGAERRTPNLLSGAWQSLAGEPEDLRAFVVHVDEAVRRSWDALRRKSKNLNHQARPRGGEAGPGGHAALGPPRGCTLRPGPPARGPPSCTLEAPPSAAWVR
jgi:hypothetical protein